MAIALIHYLYHFVIFNSMKIYKPNINEWIMIIIFVVIASNGLYHYLT